MSSPISITSCVLCTNLRGGEEKKSESIMALKCHHVFHASCIGFVRDRDYCPRCEEPELSFLTSIDKIIPELEKVLLEKPTFYWKNRVAELLCQSRKKESGTFQGLLAKIPMSSIRAWMYQK